MKAKKKPEGFKVEVLADPTEKWLGNELVFETQEDAAMYASILARSWTAVREWRVVPADVV